MKKKLVILIITVLLTFSICGQNAGKGFVFSFETGTSIGASDNSNLHFDLLGGYKFNESLDLGIGIGSRWFYNYYDAAFDFEDNIYPLYLQFRSRMGKKKAKALLELRAGYSFGKTPEFTWGGPYFSLGLGVDYPITDKISVFFKTGPEAILFRERYRGEDKYRLSGNVFYCINAGMIFLLSKSKKQ